MTADDRKLACVMGVPSTRRGELPRREHRATPYMDFSKLFRSEEGAR